MARQKTGKSKETQEKALSLDEAAQALGVSRSTLYRWQQQGRLRGFKVGRQWRFRRSELDSFSQATHPSAASVNVSELDTAIADLAAGNASQVTFDPPVVGYPATQEEKAVENAFSALLASAAAAGASDIHIDAHRGDSIVRQRIDGVLHETLRVPKSSHAALVACIKAHGGVSVDQRSLPRTGASRSTSATTSSTSAWRQYRLSMERAS